METVKADFSWSGPGDDRLWLLVEPPYPTWDGEAEDEGCCWYLLRGVDADERETREITGLEIIDFLKFDCWEELTPIPMLWQIPGSEPLPLHDLLRREQQALLAELATPKRREPSVTPRRT